MPGVEPAKVVVVGGGVVGANAARSWLDLRADVTILDRNVDTLRRLDEEFQGRAKVVYSAKTLLRSMF
ncbi:NAD-binding protein [Vibrio lentus]|nr:NAD-binding protein [Vibrio lentus]